MDQLPPDSHSATPSQLTPKPLETTSGGAVLGGSGIVSGGRVGGVVGSGNMITSVVVVSGGTVVDVVGTAVVVSAGGTVPVTATSDSLAHDVTRNTQSEATSLLQVICSAF